MSRPGWPAYQSIASPAGDIPAIWRPSTDTPATDTPATPGTPALPFAALFVPPFAEEMNRTRRLMALAGQRLAQRGIASLLPDLPGTGDSPLPFNEATWDSWLDALHACAAHLSGQGLAVRLVGIRLGGLLAANALAQGCPAERLVLVDPVEDGRLHMRHWLRIRSAASLEIGPRITLSYLQSRLEAGETVEAAGYEISPQLVNHISTLKLAPLLAPLLDGAGDTPVTRLEIIPPGTEAPLTDNGRLTIAAEAPWASPEPAEPVELAQALAELVGAELVEAEA